MGKSKKVELDCYLNPEAYGIDECEFCRYDMDCFENYLKHLKEHETL